MIYKMKGNSKTYANRYFKKICSKLKLLIKKTPHVFAFS